MKCVEKKFDQSVFTVLPNKPGGIRPGMVQLPFLYFYLSPSLSIYLFSLYLFLYAVHYFSLYIMLPFFPLQFDQSVFTVLPNKPGIRPGMVLVFELFLLRGAVVPTDRVVGWGCFPIADGQFDIVEGK